MSPSYCFAQGTFFTGLGYIKPTEYRVDNEVNPLPLGSNFVPLFGYIGESLKIFGPNINYALVKGAFGLGLRFNTTGDKYRSHNLEQRNTAINGGVSVRLLFLTLSHGVDISNIYHGKVSNASIGWRFVLSENLTLMTSIGKEHLSSGYVNHYYGINNDEADYFQAYEVNSATNDLIKFRGNLKLSEIHSVAVNYSYKKFDPVIFNSPTVSKRSYGTWSLFWSYML
jgi:outer membrane scaffolding protein for murein synthesis (MipA/OmpV family)